MSPYALQDEIARVRGSGLLGRSQTLARFFEFLVDPPGSTPPKESEIAFSVFGRGASFSTEQDAVVRVYAHRLRRKLEDFYDRTPSPSGVRLCLPRGEYRIAAEPVAVEPIAPDTTPTPAKPSGRGWWALGGFAAALLIGLLVLVGTRLTNDNPAELPAWTALSETSRPLVVVVGDYYLFGDTDNGMEVERLVREFSINSKDELYAYMMRNPESAGRYTDLGLSYLPISTAVALQQVLPLLPRGKVVRVIAASSFSPDLLKSADVLYLGHLSGLGALRETAFAGSRFAFGETYDEIIDQRTGRHYQGRAGADAAGGHLYRDYGYVAGFPGPAGNRIMIIAGTRDASAQGVAEAATDSARLRELLRASGRAKAFEALYEVDGKGVVDMDTRLVVAGARAAAPKDSGSTEAHFPLS